VFFNNIARKIDTSAPQLKQLIIDSISDNESIIIFNSSTITNTICCIFFLNETLPKYDILRIGSRWPFSKNPCSRSAALANLITATTLRCTQTIGIADEKINKRRGAIAGVRVSDHLCGRGARRKTERKRVNLGAIECTGDSIVGSY
jgi:hypothetical protein